MPTNRANLGCGGLTIQYLVFLFNLVFFACGLILIIIGGIAQGFFKEYIQFFENEYKNPAMGLIILGSIILIVSFFGCCGARKQNVCLLYTFSFLIGVLLVCEIAASISIAVLRSDIEVVISENMNSTMYTYQNNSLNQETWDDIQQKLECCGTYNFTDWKNTPFGEGTRVPDSCCHEEKEDCGDGAFSSLDPDLTYYTDGCFESLKASARRNLGAIIGAAFGIAIIEVIGIWMACWLVRVVKENYEVL